MTNLRTRCATLVFWSGMIGFAAGFVALEVPSNVYFHDLVVPLDSAALRVDLGLAWSLPFELEGVEPSDVGRASPSPLILTEDGVRMPREDNHAQLRALGGGRFSHWGSQVLLTSSDGSDPTTNGRAYAMLLPGGRESPLRRWVWPVTGAGVLLVLIAIVAAPRVSRVALAGGLLGLVVLVSWDDLQLGRRALELARARERVASREADTDLRVTPVGNVTRLALDDFAGRPGDDRPAAGAELVPLELVAEGCGQTPPEALRLSEPDGCRLRGTPRGEVRACQLAELVIHGVFLQGESITVSVDLSGWKAYARFELPVTPSPDEQVLRVTRPIGFYFRNQVDVIEAVVLSGASALCDVRGISLVDEDARTRRLSHGSENVLLGNAIRRATWQSASGGFRAAWPERPGRLLKGSVALQRPGLDATCELQVGAERPDGSRQELARRTLSTADGWVDLRIELDAGDPPAALHFGCDTLPEGAVLAWSGWRLVDTSRPPRRVLLTLADALRADMLGCIATDAPATPHLDALASQGVVFERCYSQCYWTRPSMASIMSSRYVQATGVHDPSQRLPEAYPTLPEVFAAAGFYTTATVSNTNASSYAGLDQGWDELTEEVRSAEATVTEAYCTQFVEPRLLDLLDEDLLVYVHLMESHGPYGPVEQPADWSPPSGPTLDYDALLDRAWDPAPTAASRIDRYRRDVESLDGAWGAFLERMLARWERPGAPAPIVAFMSDHGEFLGENGQWSHEFFELTPPVVHVPLVIRAPGLLPAGARVTAPVQNLDVAPTLLELAGIPRQQLPRWDGRSLLDVVAGDAPDSPALSSAGEGVSLFAAYGSSGGLVGQDGALRTVILADGSEQAFAHSGSPAADRGLLPQYLEQGIDRAFGEAWARYREHGDSVRGAFWIEVDPHTSVIDPAARQALIELGYIAR